MPCPSAQALDNKVLRSNSLAAPTEQRKPQQQVAQPQGPQSFVIGGDRVGPTKRDLADVETSASSVTLSEKERKFLKQEAARMRAAHEGGAVYSEKDMARLREAQRAQNRIDEMDRDKGKATAEAIHGARGTPAVQGQVRAAQQDRAERASAAEQAAARPPQASVQHAPAGPTYDRITQCSGGRCTGSSGAQYQPVPGMSKEWSRQDGKRCQQKPAGGELVCW